MANTHRTAQMVRGAMGKQDVGGYSDTHMKMGCTSVTIKWRGNTHIGVVQVSVQIFCHQSKSSIMGHQVSCTHCCRG